ncbi:MAG: AMP-binding protein [Corynebacteriales bacterium]|nr:AMP-binding protein [Mycobacteriales bacterium]
MRELHAFLLPNGPRLVEAIQDALAGGPAILPLDPTLPASQLETILTTLRPHKVVTRQGALAPPLPGIEVSPETGAVICTSGSTGRPKGVVLSTDALITSASLTLQHLNADHSMGWMCSLPAHYIAGFQIIVRTLLCQAPLEIAQKFDTALVARTPSAFISVVPTMLTRLLDAEVDLSRFSRILLGGAPIPEQLRTRAERHGARLTSTYGMAETAGGCVYDGEPLPGVRISTDYEDRIVIKSPTLATGYRLNAALTTQHFTDEGFHTADVGEITSDGHLRVRGRVDDVIITGGIKVAAGEIGAVIAEYPGIQDVEIFGRHDDEWGQRVVAVITTKTDVSFADLRKAVATALSPAHAPKELLIIDTLPELASGKLDRIALRTLPVGQIWPK